MIYVRICIYIYIDAALCFILVAFLAQVWGQERQPLVLQVREMMGLFWETVRLQLRTLLCWFGYAAAACFRTEWDYSRTVSRKVKGCAVYQMRGAIPNSAGAQLFLRRPKKILSSPNSGFNGEPA